MDVAPSALPMYIIIIIYFFPEVSDGLFVLPKLKVNGVELPAGETLT